MSKFKVGDTVRVTGRFGNHIRVTTVTKVLKTRIVTADGGRWTLDGYRLGSGILAGSISVVKGTEDDL